MRPSAHTDQMINRLIQEDPCRERQIHSLGSEARERSKSSGRRSQRENPYRFAHQAPPVRRRVISQHATPPPPRVTAGHTAAAITESITSRQRRFCSGVPMEMRTQSGNL